MSIDHLEAELKHLSAAELRRLALNSWKEYMQRENRGGEVRECEEEDRELLAALDEAAKSADEPGARATEVRRQLRSWTSK